jgi:hypothetical protein
MKSRIIINIDGVNDLQAIKLIKEVIADGLISKGNTSYCYMTTFTSPDYKIFVSADTSNAGSHIFSVWKG